MSAIAFRYLVRATGPVSPVLMTATIVLLPGVHVATAVVACATAVAWTRRAASRPAGRTPAALAAAPAALTHGAPVAVFPDR